MITPAYKRYIESEQWKAKCELYYARRGRYCRACGTTKNLHVHHLTYERFGREYLSDLMALCHEHHRGAHAFHRMLGRRKVTIKYATLLYIKRIRQERASRRA